MVIKKSQTTSKSSAKTAKPSAKKSISSSKTKIAKKPEIKKSEKAVKAPGINLSRPKKAARPAVKKSLSEIKKLIKPIEVKKTKKITSAAKKPDKISIATAKGKKAPPKGSLKTIGVSKSETPGKKPLRKSPVKIVNIKTKITQEKTIKPVGTKKPSAKKVTKVVVGKTEGTTAKEIKAPAKTVSAAKIEKKTTVKTVVIAGSKVTPNKTIKPVSTKPPAQKVSKVVVGKTGGKTAKEIKAPAKTVSAAKIEKKTTVKKAEAKVTPQKTIKPVGTKKPPVQKVSRIVAREREGKTTEEIKAPVKAVSAAIKEKKHTVKTVKTSLQKESAIRSTIPQIKKTVQQKTVSKKTIKKKVTPSLITPESLSGIIEEKVHPHATMTQAETKPKKASKLKVFLPEEELLPEEAQQAPLPKLPEEYGENELLLMEVDPSIVFVSWEIKPDDISGEAGKLALRVYDVTGIDFDGTNANRFFDISLKNRADSKFFDIKMQGRDIIMEIGLLHPDSTFKAIKQSGRVSMPALQTFDELDIAGPLSDSETLIGY